jgi:hypothetical protein
MSRSSRPHSRRYITTEDAAVSCPSGRWGRRRTRVTECWAVVWAEELYTELLRSGGGPVRPGSCGRAVWKFEGQDHAADWEIRANAVWRHGRVFLRCPACSRLATRLYLPTAHAWLACRRCWGLTYHSRTKNNYKELRGSRSGLWAFLDSSPRELASEQTQRVKQQRAEASRLRWAERQAIREGSIPPDN